MYYTNVAAALHIDGIQTSRECCQACAAVPSCMVSLFNLYPSGAYCRIYTASNAATCANNAQPCFGSYQTSTEQDFDMKATLSNGGCGHWENGGE